MLSHLRRWEGVRGVRSGVGGDGERGQMGDAIMNYEHYRIFVVEGAEQLEKIAAFTKARAKMIRSRRSGVNPLVPPTPFRMEAASSE